MFFLTLLQVIYFLSSDLVYGFFFLFSSEFRERERDPNPYSDRMHAVEDPESEAGLRALEFGNGDVFVWRRLDHYKGAFGCNPPNCILEPSRYFVDREYSFFSFSVLALAPN